MSRSYRVAVLPGDFIGPEVVDASLRVLDAVAGRHEVTFETPRFPFGGAAIDTHGEPLPAETREAAAGADAVLMGSAGGPQDHPWNRLPRAQRVESGILALRKHLGVYANLRPIMVFDGLERLSPLKEEVARGTDLLIIRELTGGIYFGLPSEASEDRGVSTMIYTRDEVERIARVGFETARKRGGTLTSVDKANVLDVSQFWRDVLIGVGRSAYPEVTIEHLYVDNAAMQIARDPRQFDTLVTANLFGDILSDLAAVIPGSLGVLPSASLGGTVGLFEPVHGSAPDIAGQGVANPIGTILSVAMMLEHGLGEPVMAEEVTSAVRTALAEDATKDLGGSRGTEAFTDAVIEAMSRAAATEVGTTGRRG